LINWFFLVQRTDIHVRAFFRIYRHWKGLKNQSKIWNNFFSKKHFLFMLRGLGSKDFRKRLDYHRTIPQPHNYFPEPTDVKKEKKKGKGNRTWSCHFPFPVPPEKKASCILCYERGASSDIFAKRFIFSKLQSFCVISFPKET